ncbi:hypothetical protein CC78DRAFT_239312 [Lojkania enalia]|uniref:Uncharacterized protein n=1 Tax=Lojkania enalia TaxID=147567 RepID=A0A9P4TQN1_9PLEO|nr:hypothetical protein CC78DRAFT_239312 [Didymosphaeria enalia]
MSTVYCEFCEDSHKGIPYLEKMFLCVDCQLFTCEDCHDSHDRTHLRNMLRFSLIKWMEKLPRIQNSAPCRYCAKETKVRWQCQDCGIALCRNCVGYSERRIEFFNAHRKRDPDGRSFFATYPQYWSTATEWITSDCQCLELDGVVTHSITRGQRGYFCRLCRSEFGSSQCLCVECFEEDEEHREKHQFGTFEITYEGSGPENVDGALKRAWGCTQCSERFAEGKQHVHSHLHFRLVMTPFLSELMGRVAYRTCHRKELQENSIQYPNPIPWQCSLCEKMLVFDKPGSCCLKEGCGDCFCSSCTSAQRVNHRHHLFEFTVMRSPKVYLNQITCNYCSQAYIIAMAQGLWCADCKGHFICIDCILGVSKDGTPKVEDGLPHMKILKQCKVKSGWQLYVMDGS